MLILWILRRRTIFFFHNVCPMKAHSYILHIPLIWKIFFWWRSTSLPIIFESTQILSTYSAKATRSISCIWCRHTDSFCVYNKGAELNPTTFFSTACCGIYCDTTSEIVGMWTTAPNTSWEKNSYFRLAWQKLIPFWISISNNEFRAWISGPVVFIWGEKKT